MYLVTPSLEIPAMAVTGQSQSPENGPPYICHFRPVPAGTLEQHRAFTEAPQDGFHFQG